MDRQYGKVAPDNKLEQAIKYFDARQRIAIWKLDSYEDSIVEDNANSNKIQEVNYVYDLFNNKYNDIMENYVIDYIRFDFDCIVIAIKPDKWYK